MSGADRHIQCRSCGAGVTLGAHDRAVVCPYCDSPAVVERPPAPDRPDPAFVIGFVHNRERATRAVKEWLRRRGPFVRSGVKKATLTEVKGIYLPAYLYNAWADTRYSADIGENYTETETYTETDSDGNTVTRTRTVVRTEWRSLTGKHETYVADVVVTASRGVANDELEDIEPFDLRTMRRYRPEVLAGWIAEDPSLSRDDCLAQARAETEALLATELESFLPGDSRRRLEFSTTLRDPAADLVLLPVWVFAARYDPDEAPLRVLVNGQTGEARGHAPLSWIKIAVAAVAAVALVAALAWGLR